MKKTIKTIIPNAIPLCDFLKAKTPRQVVDAKTYPDFCNASREALQALYRLYCAQEKGTATAEQRSATMSTVTAMLHTIGKVNGKYISVVEQAQTEEGLTFVLFDTLLYHSFTDKIITTSTTLASLLCDRSKASKAKREAYKAMLDGTGTAEAYQKKAKAFEAIAKKVKAEQAKQGAEDDSKTIAKEAQFLRFLVRRLQDIIKQRFAKPLEDIEAERAQRNAEAKARREAQRNGKKPTAGAQKRTAKPKTTAEQTTAEQAKA